MFIIDDLAWMILDGIVDYTNTAYLGSLQNYLKGIRLLYERGEMGEEEFRRLEAQATETIKVLRQRQTAQGRRTQDISLF